jgi:tetratricopeptide (TPR) repeat protein
VRQVCSLVLAFVIAIRCFGQDSPSSPPDPPRHLERDLQGPRLDPETGSPSNFTAAPITHEPDPVRDAGLISVVTLRHKVPKKAQQSFKKATKYSKSNAYLAAAAEFQKALAIDPDFVEARANLGVQYIRLGLLESARVELGRAAERDPNISAVQADMAVVFVELGNYEMAVPYARRAVQLDVNSLPAHYILGLALRGSPDTVFESIEHFRIAAERFPEAKRELARLQSSP